MKPPRPSALWAVLFVPLLWLADSHAQDSSLPDAPVLPDASLVPVAKPKRVRNPKAAAPQQTEPAGEAAGGCGKERWSVKTLSDADYQSVDFGSVVDAGVSDLSQQPGAPVWPPFDPQKHNLPPDARIVSENSQGYAGPTSLETSVVRIRGTLVCYKHEADSDFHVVIADPKLGPGQIPDCNQWPQGGAIRGLTVIVEFPDPSCARSNPDASGQVRQSEFAGQFGDARRNFSSFLSKYGLPAPSDQFFQLVGQGASGGGQAVSVVVRGVKFFDPYHKQSGVSKYGVELHPVLCFKGQADLGSGTECDSY